MSSKGEALKVGILGGTFDPPHAGHVALAKAAREHLGLDEVIFMPAARNPNKRGEQTHPKQRLEMVRRTVEGHEGLAYSDLEITRGGPSYAVDTLSELSFAQPGEYWFILGADALRDLPKWKQPERLIRLCRLAVALRTPLTESDVMGRLPNEYRQRVDLIPMKSVEASATTIRALVARNQVPTQWLAPEVIKYIREQKLYPN